MVLTKEQAEKLLALARDSIKNYMDKREYLKVSRTESWMNERRAVFVTLTINGNLRGCIGHLNAIQELYRDVIENAAAAAFLDHRFPELRKEELSKVHIEISILTPPEELSFNGKDDLLKKLNRKKGVILTDGMGGATFLPQVWDELPDKNDFLSHLCMKAGLPQDFWEKHTDRLKIQTYSVDAYEEKEK